MTRQEKIAAVVRDVMAAVDALDCRKTHPRIINRAEQIAKRVEINIAYLDKCEAMNNARVDSPVDPDSLTYGQMEKHEGRYGAIKSD